MLCCSLIKFVEVQYLMFTVNHIVHYAKFLKCQIVKGKRRTLVPNLYRNKMTSLPSRVGVWEINLSPQEKLYV